MTSEAARSPAPRRGWRGCRAFMHHHVALEDQIDIDSLVRFLCGRAIGFVAAGGGSFGTAHVGIYKAFRERGVMFDIFVGTSVGSAMAAGFAKNLEAEHLEHGTHEIFVKAEAFGGRPGRAIRCWITRRSIARWPINTALIAGSRIAGGRSRRWRPIFRPIISN